MLLCGKELEIGDYVRVRYTTGKRFKNAIIAGKITDINEDHKQAQVNSGWCFHEGDEILGYAKGPGSSGK